MQGHRKYSDGFSDTSSVGSFMDETDREVSNLTDRAFRSLCIGEEAIYNDSEISSPTERLKAFAKEVPQMDVLPATCQEAFSYGIQYREAERSSEVTSTFQHSYMDVAQEQVLRDEHMSYMSNGSTESTWQQRRSTSRVSSLIKAFSSKEGCYDRETPDALLLKDKYRDFNNESWDKSTLLSIQRELFSSTYHQNFKSGHFQSYRNHFHALSQVDTTASLMKSANIKFHALNSTNFFFHSEFSPFQLWKDYNRLAFDNEKPSGFVSASEFPRWYDSPMYKELTAPHTFESEGRRFNRRKIEDVITNQRSRSTVIQKASAIEKRCESEMASNCPPWRRNYNFVRGKLPTNRPSTVSPTNEKMHRPDSSLLSHSRHAYDIHSKAGKVGDNELSIGSTPFNITQLLTPVIHGRQETETSEILQFAHTPTDHFVQGDIDLKPISDAKQLRDSYKSKASSLLFNLKDNRKRVKSTYSPSKFKGLEMTDQNKQPIKLEDLETQTLSDAVITQENSAGPYSWELGDVAQQSYDVGLSQTAEHKESADGLHDNMTSVPHYGASNYKIFHEGSQSSSLHSDKHSNKESVEYEFSEQMLSAQKSTGNSEGHIYGPSRTLNYTRPEIEKLLPKVHSPTHSPLAQMSEKQLFGKKEYMGYHEHKERQNKTMFEYAKNQVIEEKPSWQNPGFMNTTNTEMLNSNATKDSLPFKGEIAALIEMDKQRKATAKQYLPSANYGYTTEKEKYINKVNEDIKQGRLTKEEEILNTDGSSLKYPYITKLAQYNSTDVSSRSQNLYAQNDSVYKMTSFSSKESSLSRTSEIRRTTNDKAEVCFQRDVKYATSDTTAENDYSPKIQCSTSLEEKHQKNEGSVAYQPYKYEPNKQWHIATTESRHGMDEVSVLTQLQAERAPKARYQGDMMTDIRKLNVQSTEPNGGSRTRDDKFSINDILSIRDNEQAKRVKENKHTLTADAGDLIKLENHAPSVISHTAEEKAPKIDAFKVKEKHTTKDTTSYDNHKNSNMVYGSIRKESHKPNEGFVNTGTFNKDKSGKETVVGKENDKITPRILSYKERGQTKQEMLTSKLKAHAQKEISAIKEKGLAKQNILSRNPMKQSTTVNNEKGQMSQEVMSPKKEITAEKLNHLFQDITYSSVTLYKENRNQDKDGPKYEPLTAEEMNLPIRAIGPQAEVALSEKNNEVVKDVKLATNEKERTKVQPPAQDERTTVVEKNTCEPQSEFNLKSSTENQREQSVNGDLNHETLPAKGLSSYLVISSSNEEALGVKTDKLGASNLPIVYCSGPTENPAFTEKKKDSPKYGIFGKTTSSLTSYNDSEQTKLLDHFVNKTEQPLDKVKKLTTNLKHPDLAETTKLPVHNPHPENQSSVEREKLVKKPKEKEAGISSNGIKSPLDLTRVKDETNTVVLPTLNSTDSKSILPAKHKANSMNEDQLKKGDDINADEVPSFRNIKMPKSSETKEKDHPELCGKQDKVQEDNTSKTNEVSVVQQLHTDAPMVKTFESASRNKENQTSNSSMEAKSELESAEVNECSLLKDLKQTKEEDLHSQKEGTQQVSQSKQEISAIYDNPMVNTNAGTRSNNQQLWQDSDRPPDLNNQIQREKDEQTEIISKEIKQSEDKSVVKKKISGSTETERSPEESNTVNVTIENNGEQMTSQTLQDTSSHIINPAPESHIINLPSKEDSVPADEPVIYSIRVSSKSDVISEDEPIIYTICVSSISDNSVTDVPESQDKSSFAPKQLSTEGAEKEEETSGNKNEEIHTDCAESKASNSKEAKGFFSSDEAQKQTMSSPATKDKRDYYRSSDVNNITSSYESLLAKYGLPIRVHPKSESKEQDKIKSKESANGLSENVQKNSDDCASTETISAKVFGGHCQESRKPKPQEEVTELSKEGEVNKQYTTHSMKTEGELSEKAVGVVIDSENHEHDVKQHSSGNRRPLHEQGITANQKALMSKVVESHEGSQDIQSAKASKLKTKNDIVELKGNTEVGQKVNASDFKREKAQKEIEHNNVLSKKAETVPRKHENENQKSNPVAGISYASVSSSTTVIDNNLREDPLQHNLKSAIPKTVTEKGQISESIDKEVAQSYSWNRVPKGEHLYKCKPDKSPVPNSQKAISEAVNPVIPELVSKDPSPTIDSKGSQNKKEFAWKNAFLGQEKDKFKTSNEIKDRRELGITASSNNDQCLFKPPNITLEDKKVTKNEHKVNKDIFTVQDKPTGQQELIKTDRVKAKDVVLPNNTTSQNVESQEVTGQKTLSTKSTEEDSKRLKVQKGKGEVAQVQKENVKGKITAVNKDDSKKSLNMFKDEKDTEGEANKYSSNLKEGIAQPHYKKDENGTDKVRKDDGQAKSMCGAMVVKDSSESIRKEVPISGEVLQTKHEDRTNVYQYHPGKGFLPETKGIVGSSHHDTVLKKTEGTSTVLPEVTQNDKKTRPEISALADYARLRVISAEDDSTNEKDLLQKMDTYHKYNLTAVEPQKGNLPVSVGSTEPKTEVTMNKKYDYQSLTTKHLQAHERDQPLFQRGKFTRGVLEEHNQCTPKEEDITHPKHSSLAKRSDDQVFAIKETGITKEKTNQMQSNTKTSLTRRHYGYRRSHEIHQSQNSEDQNTLLSQVDGNINYPSMLRQPAHAQQLEKEIKYPGKNQESLPQMSVGRMLNKADNQNVQPEINQEEKGEELEYFTVSTMENDSKPEETHKTVPFSNKMVSKKALPEIHTTRPRSNSCSPAMGKPTMFRVKDNTFRASSATKSVKPRFHRSFSEEFRITSPKEVCNTSEKSELEHDRKFEHERELNPKELANSSVLHEPMVASHRHSRMRERQSQNSLSSSEFTAAKEQGSNLRSQVFEDDETQSVISTMSEDVESVAESSIVAENTASRGYEMKSNRDTYVRPESACYVRPESACYERPESACYERPESACSDLRSLGKPPTIPPKTEKALRRAKKLTSRRIKKAETSDSQEQLEMKSTRAVSSLPSSPMDSTDHSVHASPTISTYHLDPNYAATAPGLVAHPFPMTQRKLLQDPNSGQYFMVDMPVQVKTKTFFDPETGKYVQLNVRQRTQNNHPQPQSVKVLNSPYVVYPGFLPMSVSSLPLRSSSQMSAPAALVGEQNKQETYQPNYHRSTRRYNNPVHGTHEMSGDDSLYSGNSANITQRHTDIITMSELEDFAMEST